MGNSDSREVARHSEQKVLKSLHKFGWLRTRDLASLHWMPRVKGGGDFRPIVIEVTNSARRMAQRTLRRLRQQNKVLSIKAPDGSLIYGLAEAGVRQLQDMGIPAKSGKDIVRRVSLSFFHHRRLANEITIGALLQGYRANSEHEIASGEWLGGNEGIEGKKPDALVRNGKEVWWVEVERSRRNERDYEKLLSWLKKIWAPARGKDIPVDMPGGYKLQKVVFVSNTPFIERVCADLRHAGWTDALISQRIFAVRLLYVTEAKYILIESKSDGAGSDF
ncbi:MAG: replication-relaxation family protein [Thiobacillus sp.]|nr:replication-relaxation family protein [Thiobacillus sp.]